LIHLQVCSNQIYPPLSSMWHGTLKYKIIEVIHIFSKSKLKIKLFSSKTIHFLIIACGYQWRLNYFFTLELSLSREVRIPSFGLTTPYFSDSINLSSQNLDVHGPPFLTSIVLLQILQWRDLCCCGWLYCRAFNFLFVLESTVIVRLSKRNDTCTLKRQLADDDYEVTMVPIKHYISITKQERLEDTKGVRRRKSK